MNRAMRAVIAVLFVAIIMFCAISICQNIGRAWRVDITDQKLYTLSAGTKAILAKLRQPIKLKLYYARTAALKGPDQIRYFNNYFYFVKALLQEYASAAKGMVELHVIDPRPFSNEEEQALRHGLRRFSITEEESFFFGLVLQTPFGVEKSIPFFSPDRQNFVEYDISYLIDTAVTRAKKQIGILSSLPVMGDDVTGYMAQMMRMQGRQPQPPWTIVRQLKQRYNVTTVDTNTQEIKDVDILLVIHPKNLPEKTLFAIDQFVLKGGRTIICLDPFCIVDRPDPTGGQRAMFTHLYNSDLNRLLQNWHLQMPQNTFAGDRTLALTAALNPRARPEKIIGFLSLNTQCVNTDNAITAELNQIRLLFPGVLTQTTAQGQESSQIRLVPLLKTTDRGNTWTIRGSYELMGGQFGSLMQRFVDGSEPVTMGYLITGRFKSAFPDGVEVTEESTETKSDDSNEKQEKDKTTRHLTGLTEAQTDCAVAVFADVDFISDTLAYGRSFFGTAVIGDNATLLLNTIDNLSGSGELISIRSRGNFKRPFIVVEQIERQAEQETIEEERRINAKIAGFQQELNKILSTAKKGEEEIIATSILDKKKQLELEIRRAQRELRDVKLKKRQSTERLGSNLRNFCTLPGPAAILVIAIILGVRRSVRRRHYISHASDA